jgi:hypothetical protein
MPRSIPQWVSSNRELIEKLKDIADEITEWQGTYSLQIHSSGTVLDFWFESEQDAVLFKLKI